MSLIKNLIKETENKPYKKKNGKDEVPNDSEEEKKPRPIIKSATDLQRLKLEKLMKNPDKPIVIPPGPREKDHMQTVPSFVRNVMGSSAGAGSGEFHVYRHLRRKEYARQKTIQAKSHREQLDDEYQQKLDDNRRKAEDKTAKKRAKRLKKKERAKKPRTTKAADEDKNDVEEDEESSDEEPMEECIVADEIEKVEQKTEIDADNNEKTKSTDVEEEQEVMSCTNKETKNVDEKEQHTDISSNEVSTDKKSEDTIEDKEQNTYETQDTEESKTESTAVENPQNLETEKK